jgi:hypothetical protein
MNKYTQKDFLEIMFTKEEISSGAVIRYLDPGNGVTFTINPIDPERLKTKTNKQIREYWQDHFYIKDYPGLKLYIERSNVSDKDISIRKNFVLEFDTGTIEEQKIFIENKIKELSMPSPSAIVFSGKKSLHVFFATDGNYSDEEWRLRQGFLIDLFKEEDTEDDKEAIKADPANKNPSRKMRLGGIKDNKRDQQIKHLGNKISHDVFDEALNKNKFQTYCLNKQTNKKTCTFKLINKGNYTPAQRNGHAIYTLKLSLKYFKGQLGKGNRNVFFFRFAIAVMKAVYAEQISMKEANQFLSDFVRMCREFDDSFTDQEIGASFESAKRYAKQEVDDWTI